MGDPVDDIAAAWDAIGANWAAMQGEHGDGNQQFIISPAVFSLTGKVRGRRVLDAACGGGHVARELARRGATVTAVDISARMVEIAARTSKGIDCRVADISAMPQIEPGAFDLIVCSMALMNVRNVEGAFAEFARVLRPGGRLVFSIFHPCYPRRGENRGVAREGNGDDWLDHYRVVNSLAEGEEVVDLPDENDEDHPVPTFYRTLTTYVTLLVRTGFVIDGLIEPVPPDTEEAKRELGDGWWDATRRIPYYLVVRALVAL